MTEFEQRREEAWKNFWLAWPYSFGKAETRQIFEAGYRAATAAAVRAVCYMCANPEHYSPAGRIEGSSRLWHYSLSDQVLHATCQAADVLTDGPKLCSRCGRAGMLSEEWICTYHD